MGSCLYLYADQSPVRVSYNGSVELIELYLSMALGSYRLFQALTQFSFNRRNLPIFFYYMQGFEVYLPKNRILLIGIFFDGIKFVTLEDDRRPHHQTVSWQQRSARLASRAETPLTEWELRSRPLLTLWHSLMTWI